MRVTGGILAGFVVLCILLYTTRRRKHKRARSGEYDPLLGNEEGAHAGTSIA